MSEKDKLIHIDRNDPSSPFQQGRRMAEENPEEARRIRKMFFDALDEVAVAIKCKKCGKRRLYNYTLCDKCLKKKKALATFGVIVAFLIFDFAFASITYAIAVAFHLSSHITLGFLFWTLLLPYMIKKAKLKVDEKYKIKDADVQAAEEKEASAPTSNQSLPNDMQSPKYTEKQNKDDERDKLLKRISDLYKENEKLKKRNFKKAFIAVTVALVLVVIGASAGIAYQQVKIADLEGKYQKVNLDLESERREYTDLFDKYDTLKYDYSQMQNGYNLYAEYIVFTNKKDRFYHKAACTQIVSSFSNEVYTYEAAKESGYTPCPLCCQ